MAIKVLCIGIEMKLLWQFCDQNLGLLYQAELKTLNEKNIWCQTVDFKAEVMKPKAKEDDSREQ